jgi:glycosyltransferase involved in cell wall biosynthesis
MRILICALDGPEPRTNGIRLAVAAALDELRKKHVVRYLGYRMADQRHLRNDAELRLIDPPQRPIRGATLLRAAVRRRPWETDRLATGLHDALAEEMATFRPDVVHVTRWALAGLGRRTRGVPAVLTAFDAWHLNVDATLALASLFRRPLIRGEARRVRRFEAEEFQSFQRVVVVSEQDKAALEELNPNLRIAVIPNGVDSEFFSGEARAPVEGRMIFTGHMGYPPNIVAARFLAEQIVPRVRARQPSAHLVIVGRDPAPEVLALSARGAVEVTGTVEDIRPWLRSGSVFVCPMLSGTGIKNKLLEAMAAEVPCVVTPLALQGLAVTPGAELLVGRTAEELSELVTSLISDPTAARRLGRAAREYVRRRHSWPAVAEAYEDIYRDVQSEASGNA